MKRYILIICALIFCFAMQAQPMTYSCRYWFDQDFGQATTVTLNGSTWQAELDVGSLLDGLHSLHIHVMDTSMRWSPSQSYLFFKQSVFDTGTPNYVYHCWFDQDFENRVTNSIGNGHFLFDVTNLEEGVHMVHIMLEGSSLTETQSYMFLKMPLENPTTELRYHFWFDQDYSCKQTGLVGSGFIELDVGGLSNGIHTVNVQLDNGTLMTPKSYMFYKQPVGGHGITHWEYWINGDMENKQKTVFTSPVDTLDIIALLSVGHPDIRSSCFHFHPNGEEPYINAKNDITFCFLDTDNCFIETKSYYVDEQVEQSIEAEVFERNTTEIIDAPRNNNIKWFKLDAATGDYLTFIANKACTMQLFAPSGKEVYSATTSEAMLPDGCNVWENGTYYLAIHDVTGNGETVAITYSWVYRYSILTYNVQKVGNGGYSTITFKGNGFDSLLDMYLVNLQNDTISNLDIGHESNTTTTVTLNFDETNLGMYDAVFMFDDETIRINDAIEVDEPVDIILTSNIIYPNAYWSGTPVSYSLTVTNNGNMSAYAVPLYIYISTTDLESIKHIEFEGLDLPSMLDYFQVDWDSIMVFNDVQDLRNKAKEIGCDHYFIKERLANNESGHKGVRSNYFFMNLAPNESKTMKMTLYGTRTGIETWITLPNESIPPRKTNGGTGGVNNPFCCTQELIQCTMGLVCDGLDVAGLSPAGQALEPIIDVASCICETIQNSNEILSQVICEGEGFGDALKGLNKRSLSSWIISCANAINPFKKLKPLLELADKAMGLWTLSDMIGITGQRDFDTQVSDCVTKWTRRTPDCYPGDSLGGRTTPLSSHDPNDIYGYLSESGSHYMRQEIQNVQYEIEFENDTTLATAAAHTIIVRDTLDAAKFDLNSLASRSVTIGSKRMELNGEQTFAKTLDMRPELYVIAQVEQDYDPATGIIQWTISSLDPMTMEPTDNPYQGVLPVNYFGDGVGFIDYSVNLKQTFADGTEISNRAGIIFDSEELIMTPTWTNIVDAVKPTSTIVDVTQVADTLNFTFLSEDNRSGVWYHTLYYRNDSTEMEWKIKKNQILENNYIMTLDDLQVTEYFVMATDSAGNREDKDFIAEYIYLPDNMTLQNTTLVQGWNWWSTYVEQNDVGGLQMMENSLGNNGLTIKSQDDFTTNYFETIGYNYWYGGLESVDNEQGYMINTNTTCNVKMIGVPASPSDHPITLTPNWNWIGYLVNQAQLLSASLGGFQPEDNDVMKSHSGFATYYDGYGWYPDDFIMTPGEGYLYKSNATSNKLLTYVLNRDAIPEKPTKEECSWTPVINKYAGNISVIAVVEVSGVELRDNVEIAAFVNGECRGSAILRYFEPTDRYYAMLSIVGENGDVVDFEMLDAKSDSHITLHTNDVIGNLDNPMVLGFGSNTVDLEVYPNPVDRGQEFSLVMPQWEKPSEILITNALGEIVRKESIVGSTVKGLDTSGIYMVKIICASGNVYMNKLIVK